MNDLEVIRPGTLIGTIVARSHKSVGVAAARMAETTACDQAAARELIKDCLVDAFVEFRGDLGLSAIEARMLDLYLEAMQAGDRSANDNRIARP